MSDTGSGPDESDPAQERNMGHELSSAVAKLGAGEKFAVLGAAVVLGGWALFDLLIDEYGIGHLPFALALLVVVGAYAHQQGKYREEGVPYRTMLLVAAGLIGVIGLWAFVDEIRNEILERDVTTILGALVYYGGSILSGVGALQLRQR